MKKITYFFLSLVFLASCTNLPSLGATATPQATSTFTPTFTPTITPTITSTPTETPDPNKPLDATGKDPSTGEYTKTVEESGKTTVYVWKQFQFGDDAKNGITGHWFKSWMANGPINLTGYGENCPYWDTWGEAPIVNTFALNMNVYAVDSQEDLDMIGYIFHPDREANWKDLNQSCGGLSLPDSIMSDLFRRYMNLLPLKPDESNSSWDKYTRQHDYYYPKGGDDEEGKQRWWKDHQSFVKALNDGGVIIKIGNDEWIPQTGYEVYWINESMAANDPTFLVNLQGGTSKGYYLKVIAKDGKLIAFIAPASGWLKGQLAWPKKDSRERIFRTMILFPLEATIASTYPFYNASFLPFQNYYGTAGTISGTDSKGQSFYIDTPFIDFTSAP